MFREKPNTVGLIWSGYDWCDINLGC